MQSQTLLPLPPGIERVFVAEEAHLESDGKEVDLQLKSSIEGAVIKWASTVGDILKLTSTIAFANGAHPTPMREVEFWNSRLKNLECIYDQLCDPRVKRMASYLELTDSAYLPCFKMMFKNVVAGVVEARDICLYLKPLEAHFQTFEDNEFLENKDKMKPLIHCLALLWANSRHYCRSERIVTLFQEISNLLIEATEKDLDPDSIFQGEPDEMHEKVGQCIDQLQLFMSSFKEVRNNLDTYFKENVEPVPWSFHPRNVFQRLMDFVERLCLVDSILVAALEFGKLEKVEFAGIRGRILSQKCTEIFDEFKSSYNVFGNIQYELLTPEVENIITDYNVFFEKCEELDRRLAAIFEQAFDECYNLESTFKLLNIIGTLIERPIIQEGVAEKLNKIIVMFEEEIDTVKILFDEGMKYGPPIDKNYPPVAGRMVWLDKLLSRIKAPADAYKDQDFEETEETLHVIEKYDQMRELIEKEETRTIEEWCAVLPGLIEKCLEKTHLLRNPRGLLELNLDNDLVAILREVKYLKNLELDLKFLVPDAFDLFGRNMELEEIILRLRRVVEWYNYLRTKTLPVEFELIAGEIDEIDDKMDKVLQELTWKTDSKLLLSTIKAKYLSKYFFIRYWLYSRRFRSNKTVAWSCGSCST